MSNRAVHDPAGGFAGGLSNLATQSESGFNLLELIASIFSGVGGSRFPDFLEPATTPRHRSLFHGFAFNTTVTPALYKRALRWRRDVLARGDDAAWWERLLSAMALAFVCGYASHIALDAFTPASLPLFV